MNLKIKNFVFIIMVAFFVGCNKNVERENNEDISLTKDVIKLAGSTSVSPLMKDLKSVYEKDHDVKIEIQETGSSAGITSLLEGVTQIAIISRDLTEKEKSGGLTEIPFALDGIVLIVNNENEIDNLSLEEITSIFSGDIKNWKEVGGHDGEIIVVSRENGSGTKAAFEELTNLQKEVIKDDKVFTGSLISKNAVFENNVGAIKGDVKYAKSAIGYISGGTLDNETKTLSVNEVEFSNKSVKDGSYVLARPFKMAVKEDQLSNTARNFIEFILSQEGQDIVEQSGYISIN